MHGGTRKVVLQKLEKSSEMNTNREEGEIPSCFGVIIFCLVGKVTSCVPILIVIPALLY